MKNIIYKMSLVLLVGFFSACSNISVGFEEDSIFYTDPNAEKEVVVEDKKLNSKNEFSTFKASTKTSSHVVSKQSTVSQQESIPSYTTNKDVEDIEMENQTTFSYDRNEGE